MSFQKAKSEVTPRCPLYVAALFSGSVVAAGEDPQPLCYDDSFLCSAIFTLQVYFSKKTCILKA